MSAFAGRTTRNFRQDHRDQTMCVPNAAGYCPCPLELEPDLGKAELVCSDVAETGLHAPLIDLDLPCRLLESSPGKFHLYIDKQVSWDAYLNVLDAMAKAGLVEWGYRDATEVRGFGSLRRPDRPKESMPF